MLEALDEVQRRCDQVSAEKARLERETDMTKARLVRAEKLTVGLGNEGVRWKQEAANVADQVCLNCF